MPTEPLTEEQIEDLKDSLKRCPEGTFEAALKFRETGDSSLVEGIVIGIVKRYLEPEMRPKIDEATDSTLLMEDLGIDSLTMMEVVILVEETLGVSFDNDELREIRTFGDMRNFMTSRAGAEGGEVEESNVKNIPINDILEIMPHQTPFLFIDSAKIVDGEFTATYKIRGTEDFLQGHFKNNPVFPASIMIEALGQVGVLFLLKSESEMLHREVRPDSIYFTSCDGVRCHRVCKPGDELTMTITPKRVRRPLATFEGSITVGSEKTAYAESITLLFDYVEAAS
ncbi:MAG: phosphopantetheine-binding protein [Opitutales bacterium]